MRTKRAVSRDGPAPSFRALKRYRGSITTARPGSGGRAASPWAGWSPAWRAQHTSSCPRRAPPEQHRLLGPSPWAPPEFEKATALGYRTRLSGRISRCSLRINGIRHQENGPLQRQESLLRWARNDKARTALPAAVSNQVTQDTVRDRMRRNTHPRKGDQEQGERRHLDPSLRSATSSHEPWSRNFQDTVLAQTPNPRRDEVSLRGLLQRQNGGGLKAEVRLEVRGHLPYNSTFLHPSLASLSPRLFPPSASSSGRLPLPVPHPATLLKLALRLRPARKPAASKTSK